MADDRKYDFLQLMGDTARALGEHAAAVAHYKDYLSHFGMNIPVLNGIGHCQLALGDTAEALYAFEKSLELNPKQEDLRTLVKSLKEKK
jgi:tetratricopeptide (TPR) repeat protein